MYTIVESNKKSIIRKNRKQGQTRVNSKIKILAGRGVEEKGLINADINKKYRLIKGIKKLNPILKYSLIFPSFFY